MFSRAGKAEQNFYDSEKQRQLQTSLFQWFMTETGQLFMEHEKQKLDMVLPNLFGFYLLQLGKLTDLDLLETSRVSRCRIMGLETQSQPDFYGESWSLPIKSDSIDVVILPHTLDFARYPHQVLREVERVLIPEGHVVITGFSPLSLWQLWRWTLGWRKQPPWCGHFFTQLRLRDWLTLLGFDVNSRHNFFYRPPFKNMKVMQRLEVMEKTGRWFTPFAGAGYVLVARKRVETLTPIRQKWKARKQVVSHGLAETYMPHAQEKYHD